MPRAHVTLGVIGGGSGGIAAALAAGRAGVRTGVVERQPELGGTATMGGVNCWEMGVGGTGIPFDIYRRLKRDYPRAVGVYSHGRHFCWQTDGWFWPHRLDRVCFPGGELVTDPARCYADTLRRHPGPGQKATEAFCREHWHGVPFLPGPMAATIQALLRETRQVSLYLGVGFVAVDAAGGAVRAVTLSDGTVMTADYWVDGTGGAFAHACGCATLRGRDPRSRFGEPGAAEQGSEQVNGATLVYRILPAAKAMISPLPPGIPTDCWWAKQFPPMSCVQYPDGGRNCNMLPTMEGQERVALGEAEAYVECRRRVLAHWHFVQRYWPEFQAYRLAWIAPLLGTREDRRVVCERMLTELDVRAGLSGQQEADHVAIADHALDRHGVGGGCPELDEPYGVPYGCLVPQGWRNLLVASRGAGFSSIAASSCRLTRTMMQLGQAAGTAVALAQERGSELPAVPAAELRARLQAQRVQLSWPLSAELAAHVADEAAP